MDLFLRGAADGEVTNLLESKTAVRAESLAELVRHYRLPPSRYLLQLTVAARRRVLSCDGVLLRLGFGSRLHTQVLFEAPSVLFELRVLLLSP
jgi:hypothetical protein